MQVWNIILRGNLGECLLQDRYVIALISEMGGCKLSFASKLITLGHHSADQITNNSDEIDMQSSQERNLREARVCHPKQTSSGINKIKFAVIATIQSATTVLRLN